MNLPQVYMCSPSWTLLPPSSPYHPSGPSQCTSPKHPASCIEPGLATRFLHDILHISMPLFLLVFNLLGKKTVNNLFLIMNYFWSIFLVFLKNCHLGISNNDIIHRRKDLTEKKKFWLWFHSEETKQSLNLSHILCGREKKV